MSLWGDSGNRGDIDYNISKPFDEMSSRDT